MAASQDYNEYVAAQATDCGAVRYKKMFGEYIVRRHAIFGTSDK
jgi:TfoX/Sxy family transcriptional regulator of competence genes